MFRFFTSAMTLSISASADLDAQRGDLAAEEPLGDRELEGLAEDPGACALARRSRGLVLEPAQLGRARSSSSWSVDDLAVHEPRRRG